MVRRSMHRYAVAAAAVLALGALAGCSEGSGDEEPAGADRTLVPVELSLPDTEGARCMMPSAETLGLAEIAFEGVVTEAGDERATLEVKRWFRGGDDNPTVEISSPAMRGTSVPGVEFEEGATYLVSATDGQASLCGYTAEKSDDLAALYDEAFADG